jgi:hypothetical protein
MANSRLSVLVIGGGAHSHVNSLFYISDSVPTGIAGLSAGIALRPFADVTVSATIIS